MNLLFGTVIAAGVAFLLWRTDRERLAEVVSEPYASMEIIPDSVKQRRIEGSGWGLFYSLRILKKRSCDEVIVERFVHRIGDTHAIVNNRDVSGQIVPPSNEPRITPGLHVRLASPLGPGGYFLLLRSTCYVEDESVPGKKPLSPPAEAFICFHVPDESPHPSDPQLLQPVSENCRRELAEIVLHRPQSRFAAYGPR